MVRDPDAFDTPIHCFARVVAANDALQQERDVTCCGADPREVIPAEARARDRARPAARTILAGRRPGRLVRVGHRDTFGQREHVPQIALATPEQWHIDRQHDGAVTGRDRVRDELLARLTRPQVIELEPATAGRRGARDIFETGARRGRLGVQRRRREEDRVGKVEPQERCPSVALRDVHQHSIAQRMRAECRAVRVDGALVLGATRDEVIRHLRECRPRYRLELIEVQRIHAPQASPQSPTMSRW